jgi:predicted RNase H-like HicB family nuclease
MTYEVLVKENRGRFSAIVLGLPQCSAEGATRAEALERAKEATERFVQGGELVAIEVGRPARGRSLRSLAGMWRDDETFDEFSAAMQEYRRKVDEAAGP